MDSLSILSISRCKPSDLSLCKVLSNYALLAGLWTISGLCIALGSVVRALGVRS